jgi:GRIP domain
VAASALNIDADGDGNNSGLSIVRICQRIKVELDVHERNDRGINEEVWALVEYEETLEEENFGDAALGFDTARRIKRWKKFDSESELSDFIRRDTGEPLTLPPYSLTPQQSSRITNDAQKQVNAITEEYRRFRVKSEMTRKQMDAQIRELQSTQVESAKRRIEGQEVEKELEAARTEHSQLERMRGEMSRQEAQWKEAYDLLLKENEALKSSGSEALLASQWRQRYETCLKEKEDAENKCKMTEQRAVAAASGDEYEMKYRDLKESFRLYRKKAKEIFEAQQQNSGGANFVGDGSSGNKPIPPPLSPNAMMMKISSNSNDESKLSYLKNLMVNYLTAEPEIKEHMETAIGTVLQFTPDDLSRIKQKKEYDASWGLF